MDTKSYKKFNKNESSKDNATNEKTKKEKKPFDKKTYRLKKYSNKYKVEQWEERRKKSVLRGFYKELEKDQKKNVPIKPVVTPENSDNLDNKQKNTLSQKRPNAYITAKLTYERKKEEKKQQKMEILKKINERKDALKKYKENKAEKYKKLSKKTKKGQPVMKDRLEMLLQKIQENNS